MMEPRDALKNIRELAQVASESEDIELVQKHIAMIKEIADKALKGDSFQAQVFPHPRTGEEEIAWLRRSSLWKNFCRLMLADIRKYEGCDNVTDVSIYHVTDERADSNWSVGVFGCGSAAPDTANRAAINAQIALRRKYDLLTD